MSIHRSKGLVIGAVAALALGLWQTGTAKADGWCGGGGRSYYDSSSYYSGGYAPAYVAPHYPTRTYYSDSYYYPQPYRSSFNFSINVGRDRGYSSGHHRSWGNSRHGGDGRRGHHGRRG